jgi:hypothetical protein
LPFHEAKLARKLVRVVDIYNRAFEGRIYRNSYDRANVVTLDGKDAREIYYFKMQSYTFFGSVPEDAPEFFGDWDNWRGKY